jgi:hypothetical protein
MINRTQTKRTRLAVLAAISTLLLGLIIQPNSNAENKDGKVDQAVERTRKQVSMLDDLYKTAIVLITDKYVNSDSDLPAGSAFQALFSAMKTKGWHEVRLVDATDEPLRPQKRSSRRLREGSHQAIAGRQSRLRADRRKRQQALFALGDSHSRGDEKVHHVSSAL